MNFSAQKESVSSSAQNEARSDGGSRFKKIDRVMKRHGFQQDALIEVLTSAQESYGLLDEELLAHVAQNLRLPLSWVYGVATFYHFFSLAPKGSHQCVVCVGTACYVEGADQIQKDLEERFQVSSGSTTADGRLTLSRARCLGSCGLAPVVVLDGELMGQQTSRSAIAAIEDAIKDEPEESHQEAEVTGSAEEEP